MTSSLRQKCRVCENAISETLIHLPQLPLTGLYFKNPMTGRLPNYDLHFAFCDECGHGQLISEVSPESLYDETYAFRTSHSPSSKAACAAFVNFADDLLKTREGQPILEVGCSDLYMLQLLKPYAAQRLGVDPIWKGRENENTDSEIGVIGAPLAEANLPARKFTPGTIVCRHTLEHIDNPSQFFEELLAVANDETLFLFEFPALEPLIERRRYDQIFHQHVNYFSFQSFSYLLKKFGLELIATGVNYDIWGAFYFAFRRGSPTKEVSTPAKLKDLAQTLILSEYDAFRSHMRHLENTLSNQECWGFGASQMLPVISYHSGSLVNKLAGICDDDPSKEGYYCGTVPHRIQRPESVTDISTRTFLITAPDYHRAVAKRLSSLGIKKVFSTLPTVRSDFMPERLLEL